MVNRKYTIKDLENKKIEFTVSSGDEEIITYSKNEIPIKVETQQDIYALMLVSKRILDTNTIKKIEVEELP